jgi:hypothetical protein
MLPAVNIRGSAPDQDNKVFATADPVLAKHAAEIRRLGKRIIKRTKEDMAEIGRHLVEARELARSSHQRHR